MHYTALVALGCLPISLAAHDFALAVAERHARYDTLGGAWLPAAHALAVVTAVSVSSSRRVQHAVYEQLYRHPHFDLLGATAALGGREAVNDLVDTMLNGHIT